MDLRIYHHPGCSKSRKALALLQEQGLQPEIVRYQESPPSVDELDRLCRVLGLEPIAIMRRGDSRFAELGLSVDDDRSREQWLQILHDNPILMQRPIVTRGARAAVGRPPESILEIL